MDDWVHLNNRGYRAAADVLVNTVAGTIDKTKRPDADFPGNKSEQNSYETLRSAIRKKNELFFHRWRPANWTYLLGFRKGEQGQNAVELPQFEPLIAEWETRIAKLRDLKHQDPATAKDVRSLLDVTGPKSNIEHSTSNTEHRTAAIPTFEVADGFEVNLWAEDPQLHKPIEINWDARGRLWVASSEVYPQIKPGQPATDSVVVLEDTDGNGKADKSTVFAAGLLIPTASCRTAMAVVMSPPAINCFISRTRTATAKRMNSASFYPVSAPKTRTTICTRCAGVMTGTFT
jgi:hypothetical protein